MKRCAIVGFASSSRDLAPFDDPSWEIWSLNHAYGWIKRWDVWFEMHAYEHFRRDLPREGQIQSGNGHYEWLKSQPGPEDPKYKRIYMQRHFEDIPASTPFPRAEFNAYIAKEFGSEPDYLTSSISQMLAVAIYEGYEEIGLYGIDMLNEDEYYYQRAGAEYLIGLARGMGIKVIVPQESALCKASYVYGFSEPPDATIGKQRINHAKHIVDKVTEERMASLPHYHTFDGAKQGVEAAEKMVDDLVVEFKKKLAGVKSDLTEKRELWLGNLKAADGGLNIAQSYVSWINHDSRGGSLVVKDKE